jgi:hypothetical protein
LSPVGAIRFVPLGSEFAATSALLEMHWSTRFAFCEEKSSSKPLPSPRREWKQKSP